MCPRRTRGWCSISKWKRGPGRSKGWKQSRFADLREWRRWSDFDDSRNGTLSQWTVDVPRLATEFVSPAALKMPAIPSDMLRCCENKAKASGLIFRSQSLTDKRRTFVAARGINNAYRDHLLRSRKRKSENRRKASVKTDFAARHTREYDQLEFWTEDEKAGDRAVRSQSSCPTKSGLLGGIWGRDRGQAAKRIIVPYESHNGAILGSRFQISACIRSEACFDVYVVEDLLHEQYCLAKAYTISSTKGKERDARLKNLKRSSNKASLMASIDQSGKKWLVFFAELDLRRDKRVSLDPLAWRGEQEYQLHFPGIDGRCKPDQGQHHIFSRSYASCFHNPRDGGDNVPSTKAQRARDRQRCKRQERRALKAKAREAVEVKNFLSEGREGSMEQASSCAEPDKVSKKVAPEEANGQCDSTEPATSPSVLEMTSSQEGERTDGQESGDVEAAEAVKPRLERYFPLQGYIRLEGYTPREEFSPLESGNAFLERVYKHYQEYP